MATEDHFHYEDQKTKRYCRCIDDIIPLTQSDVRLRQDA